MNAALRLDDEHLTADAASTNQKYVILSARRAEGSAFFAELIIVKDTYECRMI
jgi:hypothetical protein